MSQFNSFSYDVQRPTGLCAFTGRSFDPGESYMATLVEVSPAENEPQTTAAGLKRIDVALTTWEQGQRPADLYCYWRATVALPDDKKKLFVDDDVLMNLFERLVDAEQPDRQAFRFVLALILMRKRLLKYSSTEKRPDAQGNEQEWWRMSGKSIAGAEPEAYEVLNPGLDEQRLAQVTEQLGEILETEL